MLGFGHFLTRHLINLVLSFVVILIGANAFDQTTLMAFGVLGATILTYGVSNKITKHLQKKKLAATYNLTLAEFDLVTKQLDLAQKHVYKLNQQYIRVRSVHAFRLVNDMVKVSKRIVTNVRTNPQKFFKAESFFYAHLPSTVEMMDKYFLLTSSQMKDHEVQAALSDTRDALEQMHGVLEQDLKQVLSMEIENLRVEIDFAKLQSEKREKQLSLRGDDYDNK